MKLLSPPSISVDAGSWILISVSNYFCNLSNFWDFFCKNSCSFNGNKLLPIPHKCFLVDEPPPFWCWNFPETKNFAWGSMNWSYRLYRCLSIPISSYVKFWSCFCIFLAFFFFVPRVLVLIEPYPVLEVLFMKTEDSEIIDGSWEAVIDSTAS